MRIALASVLVFSAMSAFAADSVYRWVDKDGVIHYGGQPPSKDAKPAALPEIQTYSNRASNKALPLSPLAADVKPAAAASVKEVRILAPVQDETFRDPQGVVNVAVSVSPALPVGAGVIFYLDGAAKNVRPIAATSMTFSGIERGEHSVTAAVLDVAGKELMRASPVTFHLKPPAAR